MHPSGFFSLCAPSRYREIYGFYSLAAADPSATRAEACSLVSQARRRAPLFVTSHPLGFEIGPPVNSAYAGCRAVTRPWVSRMNFRPFVPHWSFRPIWIAWP